MQQNFKNSEEAPTGNIGRRKKKSRREGKGWDGELSKRNERRNKIKTLKINRRELKMRKIGD
ncbi:unnamed protein product [Meloidogyne enterolobii]|uniref:Uncharacterized protein n=1 Tax=Meloidogyne enterolobii TaxID=390850 RepID=A0ACB1ADY0_MELEN